MVLIVNPETKRWIINMNVFPEKLFASYQKKEEGESPDGFGRI